MSEEMTLLQWLAPEFARAGLLRNADWVPEHATRALEIFSCKPLAIAATAMAVVDRSALEYIQQAPALVVMAALGVQCDEVRQREYIAGTWLKYIRASPKLRDLLKAYSLVQQLRALNGKAFTGGHVEIAVVRSLCNIAPSHLAQSIPTSIRKQRNWLKAMAMWQTVMERRTGDRDRLFEWAAFAIGRDIDLDHIYTSTDTIADFAIARGEIFNERWTYQRALAESLSWHEMIAKQSSEEAFLRTHKIGWDQPVDYGRLPDAVEIDGFNIVALRTGAALFAEGRAMRHCVASYSRDVVRGDCFIYSVRGGDRRLATFEISRRTLTNFRPIAVLDTLSLDQLKGPCNSPVSVAVREAVSTFINRCNGVHQALA